MANNKVKVKGINGRSTRPMSYDHVTTIDLNVVKPFGLWEMVPGDKLDLDPEVWMRTQNLACPTFGKVDCITRAFFVPHRLIYSHFLDFWSGNSFRVQGESSLSLSEVPNTSIKTLSNQFELRFNQVSASDFEKPYIEVDTYDSGTSFSLSFGVWFQDSHATNDFSDFDIHFGATHSHYRFNPLGKRVWDLLYSLGYRFNFSTQDTQDNYNDGAPANWAYDVNLMPILSYLKIFYDWYCPSEFRYLFNIDDFAHQDSALYNTYAVIQMYDMISYSVFVWYNDDIFSLCEHKPYSKLQVSDSQRLKASVTQKQYDLLENDILQWTSASGSVVTGSDIGARVNNLGQSDIYDNNSWTVRALQRVANLLQKNNLLTPRAQDYLKAKFGVEPTAARLDVSEYLGHASAPVKISDVVSTEASDGKLGELGGKGTSYQIQHLSYKAEEFGYFILTIELRPRVDYGLGFNPICLRVDKEDYWQEEIDGLGFTPVPTHCLVSGPLSFAHVNESYSGVVFNKSATDNRIFGYLPKFWSYKINHGNLSGDFNIPKNVDIQAYHLFRTIEPTSLSEYVHNSLKFRYPGLCFFDNDYTRIFMHPDRGTLRDHFQLIGSFECYINGYVLGLSESWQVNPDGEERQGKEQHIQSVL